MKPSKKANSSILPNSDDSANLVPSSRERRARKRARGSAKGRSSLRKHSLQGKKRTDPGSGIREIEEARALLEKQLHSLYWWVFNACKMKGFIRAKGLHEAMQPRLDSSDDA